MFKKIYILKSLITIVLSCRLDFNSFYGSQLDQLPGVYNNTNDVSG